MANSLPAFPQFEVHTDTGSVGPRWRKWLSRFERLIIGLDINDDKRKRALLLHYAGPEVDEIFDTLANTGDYDDYNSAVTSLNSYFTPKVNPAFEVYNFRQAKQKEEETLDSYHTRLRQLAQTCDFADVEKEIAAQIILNGSSQKLRRRALRDNLNLQDLLEAGRAIEISEQQAQEVESSQPEFKGSVNTVHRDTDRQSRPQYRNYNKYTPRRRSQSRKSSTRTNFQQNSGKSNNQCYSCGGQFPHKNRCPAKGKPCHSCGKLGHFAKMCIKDKNTVKNVNHSENQESNENDYVYGIKKKIEEKHINSDKSFVAGNVGKGKLPGCVVNINGQSVTMTIDSGASVNIMDNYTYQKLEKSDKQMKLDKCETEVFAYGSSRPLPVLGVLTAKVTNGTLESVAKLHIVEGNSGNLLGCQTAQDLKFLHLTQAVLNKSVPNPSSVQDNFPKLFEGIGKVKDKEIKLHIDTTVQPKAQPHRRIPFHVRKDVENELEKLEALDIIEKVDGPTPWVSPIVVVPKRSGSVRICIDMREANKAIQREKHLMPTIDELVNDLNGAAVFTKLDLTAGYHQFELSEESRYITTFSTHVGLRRYKRLMFGINAAPEIFQNCVAELLHGLPGCRNLTDDILVWGKDQKTHDDNLHRVLERLQQNNVTLNREKCVFSQTELSFYGHTFGADGLKPDSNKVSTILNASPPTNVSEVKSLLGMAQYVSKFIPGYATLTAPLRELTRKDIDWTWTERHQTALDNLKQALSGAHVMEYFDPKKETEILVDASPVGLGAILTQGGKVISYASRALSDVETRYSQTEREMLAVVWGAEHFHLYVYGKEFTMYTDHKPLLWIFKSQKPASARIERWRLRLMPYRCDIRYRPGRDDSNPADYISRHPNNPAPVENIAEDYVNYTCTNAVPKAMSLNEIKTETKSDIVIQKLISAIRTGNWSDKQLRDYVKLKDEFSVCDELVLRGSRIVVPTSLHRKAVDLAHVGHQGIVKTKRLIREKVWFPGIDKLTEEIVRKCIPCQASTHKSETREPLLMSKLPENPWQEVSVDFAGPFPSGEYLLVVTDNYSRYPEVEIVLSTSSQTVIPKLDAIFARQGIPKIVKSDNGPPFNGQDFRNFATYLGFEHRRITPFHPEANGETERFMGTLNKAIRASCVEKKNWKQELFKFLRQYRATPHSTTGISPFEALTGRKMNTTLPVAQSDVHRKLKSMDSVNKDKIKFYADSSRHTKYSKLSVGDTVLIRQRKRNKLTPPFNPAPYRVVARKGTMVTAQRGSHQITRNTTFFKIVPPRVVELCDSEENSDEEYECDISVNTGQNGVVCSDQSSVQSQSQSVPLTPCLRQPGAPRRSQRQHKMPVRFKDFVTN